MLRWRRERTALELVAEKQRRARFRHAGWGGRALLILAWLLRDAIWLIALPAGLCTWILLAARLGAPGWVALLAGLATTVSIVGCGDLLLNRLENRWR